MTASASHPLGTVDDVENIVDKKVDIPPSRNVRSRPTIRRTSSPARERTTVVVREPSRAADELTAALDP